MSVITVNCKSTKCYLVPANQGYLLFDAGWPGEYPDFRGHLKEKGLSVKDIRHMMVSHFHMDHAGLAGTLSKNGVLFTVFENQTASIAAMEELIARKNYPYDKIDPGLMIKRTLASSRDWLKSLGISGEVIAIHGHGDINAALVLDGGEALIGDLPVEYRYDDRTTADWDRLYALKARVFYPAHAPGFRSEGPGDDSVDRKTFGG